MVDLADYIYIASLILISQHKMDSLQVLVVKLYVKLSPVQVPLALE